jgi:hypothetical protein
MAETNRSNDATRTTPPSERARTDDGRIVGESVGGVTGTAAGAAIGSMAGPIGTLVGALAGAVGGWWAGRDIATDKFGLDHSRDDVFRNHFATQDTPTSGRITYEQARPAYHLGHLASQNPDYRGKSFDQVEGDMREAWNDDIERTVGFNWNEARAAVAHAFETGSDPSRP